MLNSNNALGTQINAQVAAGLQFAQAVCLVCRFLDDNAQYKPANVSQHCVRAKLSWKQVTTTTTTTNSRAKHDRQCLVPGQSSEPLGKLPACCAHKYAAQSGGKKQLH